MAQIHDFHSHPLVRKYKGGARNIVAPSSPHPSERKAAIINLEVYALLRAANCPPSPRVPLLTQQEVDAFLMECEKAARCFASGP